MSFDRMRNMSIIFLCLCLSALTLEAGKRIVALLDRANSVVNDIEPEAKKLIIINEEFVEKAKTTVDNVNQTLSQLRAIGEAEKNSLEKQNAKAQEVLEQTETALINLQIAVDDIDKNTGKVSEASVQAVNQLQPLLIEATTAVKNAGILMADPKLKETAANMAVATNNLSLTTGNINHSTKQIDDKITQMLKPVSLGKALLREAFSGFTKVGDIRRATGK